MEEKTGGLLENIQVGSIHTYRNMSVAPLKSDKETSLEYLTLSQAMAKGLLVIREVTIAGNIPELSVLNMSRLPVLLLDGEEVQGAKKNRALNTSILVPPGANIVIPVSCTEQGRWDYTSWELKDSGVLMPASIRACKQAAVTRNVRQYRRHASDQNEIWEQVVRLHQDLDSASSTGALRDAYHSKQADLDDYVQAFAHIRGHNGVAVFVDNQLVGLDLLCHRPAMDNLLPKLIASYAMDALRIGTDTPARKPAREQVELFLQSVGRCTLESHPSQGMGEDARLECDDFQGAALIAAGEVIHLAAFAKSIICTPQ